LGTAIPKVKEENNAMETFIIIVEDIARTFTMQKRIELGR
jgi:hypothetical protein